MDAMSRCCGVAGLEGPMDPGRWRTVSALLRRTRRPAAGRTGPRGWMPLRTDDPGLGGRSGVPSDRPRRPATSSETPPAWGTGTTILPDDPLEGELVGPYRIVERVGAGGMGVVYRAVRADDQYRKEVALKLVRRGMDTEQVLRRFRTERQILANLDHPNIARLLDGGVAPDGRPYLVMEFVDGDARRHLVRGPATRTSRDRLELFLTVCDAVRHAHRNLVVHRDLKPANILVTADGRVQLLDFGVAKLLDPAAVDLTQALTAPGMRLLTPRYASPELLRGEPADTLADVWSLGAILCELLTGRPAFTHGGSRSPRPWPGRWTRARLPGRARSRSASADACKRRPGHHRPHGPAGPIRRLRYGSVEALAEDVRRHLDRTAHRRPARGAAATGPPNSSGATPWPSARPTAVFALTLVFAVLMAGQAARIGRQARETAQQRDRAERVTALLVDMFDVSDPMLTRGTRGDTLSVRDFLIGSQDAMVARLDTEPLLQADILHMYGRLFGNLGESDRALAIDHRGTGAAARAPGPGPPGRGAQPGLPGHPAPEPWRLRRGRDPVHRGAGSAAPGAGRAPRGDGRELQQPGCAPRRAGPVRTGPPPDRGGAARCAACLLGAAPRGSGPEPEQPGAWRSGPPATWPGPTPCSARPWPSAAKCWATAIPTWPTPSTTWRGSLRDQGELASCRGHVLRGACPSGRRPWASTTPASRPATTTWVWWPKDRGDLERAADLPAPLPGDRPGRLAAGPSLHRRRGLSSWAGCCWRRATADEAEPLLREAVRPSVPPRGWTPLEVRGAAGPAGGRAGGDAMRPAEVTALLVSAEAGDTDGPRPRAAPDLRRAAATWPARHLGRERAGHTLTPTALVHEAYLKLVDQTCVAWRGQRPVPGGGLAGHAAASWSTTRGTGSGSSAGAMRRGCR